MERKTLMDQIEKKMRKAAIAAKRKRKLNNKGVTKAKNNVKSAVVYRYNPLPHATKLKDALASNAIRKDR
jgi:hypothetical protein